MYTSRCTDWAQLFILSVCKKKSNPGYETVCTYKWVFYLNGRQNVFSKRK